METTTGYIVLNINGHPTVFERMTSWQTDEPPILLLADDEVTVFPTEDAANSAIKATVEFAKATIFPKYPEDLKDMKVFGNSLEDRWTSFFVVPLTKAMTDD